MAGGADTRVFLCAWLPASGGRGQAQEPEQGTWLERRPGAARNRRACLRARGLPPITGGSWGAPDGGAAPSPWAHRLSPPSPSSPGKGRCSSGTPRPEPPARALRTPPVEGPAGPSPPRQRRGSLVSSSSGSRSTAQSVASGPGVGVGHHDTGHAEPGAGRGRQPGQRGPRSPVPARLPAASPASGSRIARVEWRGGHRSCLGRTPKSLAIHVIHCPPESELRGPAVPLETARLE